MNFPLSVCAFHKQSTPSVGNYETQCMFLYSVIVMMLSRERLCVLRNFDRLMRLTSTSVIHAIPKYVIFFYFKSIALRLIISRRSHYSSFGSYCSYTYSPRGASFSQPLKAHIQIKTQLYAWLHQISYLLGISALLPAVGPSNVNNILCLSKNQLSTSRNG